MIIDYLADHRDAIPTLARWTFEEWSYLHPGRTLGDVGQLIAQSSNKDNLPISLVAIDDGRVVGMVTLKSSDFKARPDLSPWLAGLFVHGPHRGKGIGVNLVRELEQLAGRLGISKLYLVTDKATAFYTKLGWCELERKIWQGHAVTLMSRELVRPTQRAGVGRYRRR